MNREILEQRIDQLMNQFEDYLRVFAERRPYRGPSIYFHERVIDLVRNRNNPLDRLLQSREFIEYLYAVLTSWGMHRMDGKAQLVEFDNFTRKVGGIRESIIPLASVSLGEARDETINTLCEVMFQEASNTIMVGKSRLVGNSKLLHHLLPDLVPPIDRANTLWFFGQRGTEEATFRFVMEKFKIIHNRIVWFYVLQNYNGPMKTSQPKIIDNAIVGYCLKHKL